MKYLAAVIVILMLVFSALSLVSSDSTPIVELAYGDTTSGLLNNNTFEWIYEFEGAAGDTIMVEFFLQPEELIIPNARFYVVRQADRRRFDPNMAIPAADSQTSGSGLLMQLDVPGTYFILVERNERRLGLGRARFGLSVDLFDTSELETSWHGNLALNPSNQSFYFFADNPGTYRILMGQPGLTNPGFRIDAVTPGTTNFAGVIAFEFATIDRVHLDVKLAGNTLYIVRLFIPPHSPYIDTATSATYPFNISITPVDDRPQ